MYLSAFQSLPSTRHDYDRTLRLTSAARNSRTIATNGGAFESHSDGYDGRGNRTSLSEDGHDYTLTYGTGALVDRLTSISATSDTGFKQDFAYDDDGRVSTFTYDAPRSSMSDKSLAFAYGQTSGVAPPRGQSAPFPNLLGEAAPSRAHLPGDAMILPRPIRNACSICSQIGEAFELAPLQPFTVCKECVTQFARHIVSADKEGLKATWAIDDGERLAAFRARCEADPSLRLSAEEAERLERQSAAWVAAQGGFSAMDDAHHALVLAQTGEPDRGIKIAAELILRSGEESVWQICTLVFFSPEFLRPGTTPEHLLACVARAQRWGQ